MNTYKTVEVDIMFPARFTERVRMVINYANDEAIKIKHNRLDTEHLLLGLIREGE
ncbi:hypothetical protein GF312_03665 [Candidatus Poribacteria bacterium]|nr:hypothetical protein [Candidatus Poribacteria bacterium]